MIALGSASSSMPSGSSEGAWPRPGEFARTPDVREAELRLQLEIERVRRGSRRPSSEKGVRSIIRAPPRPTDPKETAHMARPLCVEFSGACYLLPPDGA